jgi:hypothetical protein
MAAAMAAAQVTGTTFRVLLEAEALVDTLDQAVSEVLETALQVLGAAEAEAVVLKVLVLLAEEAAALVF